MRRLHARRVLASGRLGSLGLLLLLPFSLAPAGSDARAGSSLPLPPESVDHLVVTRSELAPSFAALAQHRDERGLRSMVITLDWIEAQGFEGRDRAERIRHFLTRAHAEWGVRFVLLGADTFDLPVRMAFSEFYPYSIGTEIPTDLYYAALDGDWDADGDGVFGEVEDDVDLDPDLAVGRVPVDTVHEAEGYVGKVLAYEALPPRERRSTALLYEVLFPSEWDGSPPIYDGATDGEEVRALLVGAGEVDPVRLYENHLTHPGALPLTRASALDVLRTGGFGWVSAGGHGAVDALSVGDGLLLAADLAALTNRDRPFVFFDMHPASAAFEQDCFLERSIRNPEGGSVAAVGASRANFPVPTNAHMKALFEEAVSDEVRRIGLAMNAARRRFLANAQFETVDRWTALQWTLLGDPALDLGPGRGTVAPVGAPPRVVLHPARPNPFNPSVTIAFSLEAGTSPVRVRLEIFDLAGHHLRTLWDGTLSQHHHEFLWDGRDDVGEEVATGTYFATVTTPLERRAVKLTLLK